MISTPSRGLGICAFNSRCSRTTFSTVSMLILPWCNRAWLPKLIPVRTKSWDGEEIDLRRFDDGKPSSSLVEGPEGSQSCMGWCVGSSIKDSRFQKPATSTAFTYRVKQSLDVTAEEKKPLTQHYPNTSLYVIIQNWMKLLTRQHPNLRKSGLAVGADFQLHALRDQSDGLRDLGIYHSQPDPKPNSPIPKPTDWSSNSY